MDINISERKKFIKNIKDIRKNKNKNKKDIRKVWRTKRDKNYLLR